MEKQRNTKLKVPDPNNGAVLLLNTLPTSSLSLSLSLSLCGSGLQQHTDKHTLHSLSLSHSRKHTHIFTSNQPTLLTTPSNQQQKMLLLFLSLLSLLPPLTLSLNQEG